MNCFDALVVAVSVAEVVVQLVPGGGNVGPLSVLRSLRFLRLARLVQRWEGLRAVVATLVRSVRSVAWMSLLLCLFLVIAALLGMQVGTELVWVRGGVWVNGALVLCLFLVIAALMGMRVGWVWCGFREAIKPGHERCGWACRWGTRLWVKGLAWFDHWN